METAAAAGGVVITAPAENHLHGVTDLDDTSARPQPYEAVGAPVAYAPGPANLADIERLVQSVERPLNVMAGPGAPSVSELSSVGVKPVSVATGLAWAALGAALRAALELLENGTYNYWDGALSGAIRAEIFDGE